MNQGRTEWKVVITLNAKVVFSLELKTIWLVWLRREYTEIFCIFFHLQI